MATMSRRPSYDPFAQRNPSAGISPLGNAKVLVAEDPSGTLPAITPVLESAGCDVVVERDGLAALRAYERERPDLVVLDLDLPTMSGFRLIQLFCRRELPATAPVVVVTAYDYDEVEEVARQGVADVVTKPFDARGLLARLDFALLRSRQGGWAAHKAMAAVV